MNTIISFRTFFILLILAAISSLATNASSQVPRLISYQGVLANGGAAVSGQHLITVGLYDSLAGGTMLYQESQEITVSGGVFNMEIGSQSPIPLTLAFDRPYFLGVSVDGNAEMAPRTALSAAPYAMNANIAILAEGLIPDAKGVVTSINELAGPLRITGDSITTITESGNDIIIHARATPGAVYTAGQGITISNDVISATGGLPAGTALNSTLRWNGSEWAENPYMTSDANGNTRINGSATLGDGIGNDSITMNPGTGVVKVNGFGAGVVKSSANGVLSPGLVDLTTDVTNVLPVINGGTGLGILTSGQLLVGNGTNPVSSTQLTAGAGISIVQNPGIITITNTGSVGWALTGNAGTSAPTNFLGTTDNQPFEIHVYDNDAGSHGSKRVMRYEPNLTSPNLIGGYQGNGATNGVVGAVIGGGGLNGFNNTITDDFSFVGGGSLNRAGNNSGSTADAGHATVGGGGGNTASAVYAAVLGGDGNTASGASSAIGGGSSNQASGAFSAVTGGLGNQATDTAAVVSGGGNTAGRFDVVSGGINNIAGSFYSAVSGGVENGVTGQRSAIAGGGWLGLGGAGSFGFHNGTSAADSAFVNDAATAFFGNVNLWLGNTNNTASQLRLYGAQNGGVNFPAASTHYSGFASGAQSSDINYTLPTSPPSSNDVLTATAVSGSGPYGVTLGWSTSSGSGSEWNLTGNSGTTAGTNFIGTTDSKDFVVKTNSNEIIRVTSGGFVGIGTNTPIDLLNVVSTTGGNAAQLENNNNSTGLDEQAALVVTNLTTTSAPTEIAFGHSNSAGGVFGGATIDMIPVSLTSGSESGSLIFGTNNNGGSDVTEKMRLTYDGKLGIGTTSPQQKLEVANGNVLLSRTGANADTLQLQGTSSGVSSFAAGAQGTTTINYNLPTSQPSANQVLTAASVSGSGPYAITLGWSNVSGSDWGLTGNSGTTDGTNFLGTTDNTAFTIRVNNLPELRIQPSPGTTTGSMIGGGADNTIASNDTGSFIGFGQDNRIAANDAIILGGALDTISASGGFSIIAGSFGSTITDEISGIVGGEYDYISSPASFIAGGYIDTVTSYGGFVGGGSGNAARDDDAAIVGGVDNVAYLNSFVGGGIANYAGALSHSGAAVIGGWHDTVYADNSAIVAGQYNSITLSSLYSAILAGTNNFIDGSNTTVAGGGFLRLTGSNSFGFHAGTGSTDSAYVSANDIAFFGNTNMWLGNTNNTADQLRFYGPQNGGITFPSASTHYSSLAAGSQSSNINYTLPLTAPSTTGNLLWTTSGTTSSMSWTGNLVWDEADSRLGINTTTPAHPLHSVNAATTDEIAAIYGIATAATSNQAIGAWGRANNTSSSNTGTIGVLATGNGNTTAGQTNVALQLNDGEFAIGRTTESPSVGSDVEQATGGTAYSQQGPSGIVELTLGSSGNLTTSAPTAGIIQDLGSVTINNRYTETGSVVLTNIVAMIDDGVAPNPQNAAWIVNADNTSSGSFVIRVKMIPTVTNASNYLSSDKIRIGYVIVNKSK